MMELNNIVSGMKTITKLECKLIKSGYCKHIERVTNSSGKWQTKEYPVLTALLKHPTAGYILFDAGYSDNMLSKLKKFPYSLYKKIVPFWIDDKNSLRTKLSEYGITSKDISKIILSHFHPDHIGGICDFDNSKFVCSKEGYNNFINHKKFKSLLKGNIKSLLPDYFEKQAIYIEDSSIVNLPEELYPFTDGYDILGDQSLIAIPLPGHARGQIGLFFYVQNGQQIFLVADSCWSSQAYKNLDLPSFICNIIQDDQHEYRITLHKLHSLYKNNQKIKIIPSHCDEVVYND